MNEPTPGPWQYIRYADGASQGGRFSGFISGGRGDNTYIIAEVCNHTEDANYMPFSVEGMSDANGRRIASAPDMEKLLEQVAGEHWSLASLAVHARLLLAKIRGEE